MLLSVPGKVLNKILQGRMKEVVDPMNWEQQAGFRPCDGQIAVYHHSAVTGMEVPLNINFIDYKIA